MSRTVVVTGGKRGIGVAICAAFAGENVIPLSSSDLDVTDEAAVADGARARWRSTCWSTTRACPRARRCIARRLEEWERQIRVNATGAFLCARAVLPGMRARDRGRIVTVASLASHVGSRYTSGYTASKHAVLGLTRAVAAEVAGTGITCNAVCPAYVRSDMTDATIANIESRTGKDGEAALASMAALGRLIEPSEVAFAVQFFASAEAGAINGQTLIMDGGGVQQ